MIWDSLILVGVCVFCCVYPCICVCVCVWFHPGWLWSICNEIKRSDFLKVTMCTWYSEAINKLQTLTTWKSGTFSNWIIPLIKFQVGSIFFFFFWNRTDWFSAWEMFSWTIYHKVQTTGWSCRYNKHGCVLLLISAIRTKYNFTVIVWPAYWLQSLPNRPILKSHESNGTLKFGTGGVSTCPPCQITRWRSSLTVDLRLKKMTTFCRFPCWCLLEDHCIYIKKMADTAWPIFFFLCNFKVFIISPHPVVYYSLLTPPVIKYCQLLCIKTQLRTPNTE